MAGHEAFDPYQESSFIESLDPRYQTTAAVKEMYTFELEHVLREPFFQYELTMMPNGEFGMYNTSMSEMVDPTELGGRESLESMNQIAKVFQERSDISVATFHSRDIGFGRDYIYKFQKMENGNILATAIEYNGFEEDRQALRHVMETRAIPIHESRMRTQDLYTPLFFTENISMKDFGQMAEQSYQTQQSQAVHSEYRLRLGVAAAREHEVFQNQNDRMTQLLTTMQEKVNKYSNPQEAFEAIYQELVEYAYRPEVVHAPGLKRKDQRSTLSIDNWSDSFNDKGEGSVIVSQHQREIEERKFEKEVMDSTNTRLGKQRTISQQQYRIAEQRFEKEVVDSTTAKPRILRHEQIAPPNSIRPVVLAEKKASHQHMEIPVPYIPAINVVDGAIPDTGMSALGYVHQVDTSDSVPTRVQSVDLFARLRQKFSTYYENIESIKVNGEEVLEETFSYTFITESTEQARVEMTKSEDVHTTESTVKTKEQSEQIEETIATVRTVLEEAHAFPDTDTLMFIALEQINGGFESAVDGMSQVLPSAHGKDQLERERIMRIYEHVEQLDKKVTQAQETLKLIPLVVQNPNLIGGFMIHLLNVTEPISFTQKQKEPDVETHSKHVDTTGQKDVDEMKKSEEVNTLKNENILQILVRLQDIMMKYPLRRSDTFFFPESIKETPISKSIHITGSEKGITLQTKEGTFLLKDTKESEKNKALSLLSRFSFSLGVFFLLRMLDEQKNEGLVTDSEVILKQNELINSKESILHDNANKTDKKDEKKQETFTEDSSWLLLSIIWYMSQIREQGIMGLIVQKPATKKHKRKKNLPSSGIIFLLVR